MPTWLQILLGVIGALSGIVSIIIVIYIFRHSTVKSDIEDELALERRLVALETTMKTLDNYMTNILLRNLSPSGEK